MLVKIILPALNQNKWMKANEYLIGTYLPLLPNPIPILPLLNLKYMRSETVMAKD